MSISRYWGAMIMAAVLLVTVGCGGASKDAAPSATAAKTIRVVAANHNWTDTVKPLLPEFEKKTGIKVNFESYSEDQLTQKLTVEFTANASTIDVFMTRPLQEGKLFSKNNWYQPLTAYINDQQKTPADWAWNDFQKSAVLAVTLNNNAFAVPIVTEWEILYYRKDLLEKANIAPPKTLAELEAAAAKLNNPAEGLAGIVSRGQRGAAVTQFSSYLFGFGGDFLQNGKCVLNTPAAVEAIAYYGRILGSYGPPGVTNVSWPQGQALFSSGKAAMFTDASSLLPGLITPSKSAVADKVGFAVFPAGPAGAHPYMVVPWALAISNQSKQKDAAWEFVKWITGKEMMKKTQLAGNTMARNSAWDDPEVLAKLPPGFADVAKKTAEIAVPYDRPLMTAVGEARDAIGDVIVKSIETKGGADLPALLKDAVAKVDALLEKAGEGGK